MDEERGKLIAKYALWGFLGLIAFLILMAMFSSFFTSKKKVERLNKEITLVVGDKYSFDFEYDSYKSENSNDKVAIVTNTGEIEALNEGITSIVITTDSRIVNYSVRVEEDTSNVVQNIKLQSNTIQIKKDEVYNMSVIIIPSTAKNVDLTWYSSNENVATVSQDGSIKGISQGSCTITVKTSNGNVDTCLVKVTDDEQGPSTIEKITLDTTKLVLKKNAVYTLNYKTVPEKTSAKLLWISSDSSVIKVEDGVITALSEGSATLTVRSGNITESCYITVVTGDENTPDVIDDGKTIQVDSVSLNQQELSLLKGTNYTLIALVSPDNATDKSIVWESSNTKVATVDQNGNINAVSIGEAVIKATTKNGKTSQCTVTVINKKEEPEKVEYEISLNNTTASLEEGEGLQLVETITPNNTHTMSVTWESSNTSIATVANGYVTALKEGTATITATLENGKSASCNITVSKKEVKPILINLNATYVTLRVNGTSQLTATVLPKNSTNKTITWESSDSNIVSVNSNGRITGKKKGRAVITARAHNGVKAECVVVVN